MQKYYDKCLNVETSLMQKFNALSVSNRLWCKLLSQKTAFKKRLGKTGELKN